MNMVKNCLSVAVLVCSLLATALTSDSYAQGGGNRVRLEARMAANGMRGTAKWEQRADRIKFNYQLEKGTAGTVVEVQASTASGQVVLGSFTVDTFGRGTIDIDSRLGHNVPLLAAGDTVSARVNGVTIMSGVLLQR